MSARCGSPAVTGPRLGLHTASGQDGRLQSGQQKDARAKLRMLDQKYIFFLFLISCQQQHDSKMKNNSVSYFFTQRDRQTDPPTAAAATTTRDHSARHWDTQIPEGTAGPGSEEGFSPFFLPRQPMRYLREGLTWAFSPWLSPGHFL